MKEKGLSLNMLLLIYLTLFLDVLHVILAQTEFTVSTELPVTGSMPREGDTAYVLKCEIQAVNITENTSYTYIWTKEDIVVSIGGQVHPDYAGRFSISNSSNMGTDVYQISISTVEVADSGIYTCVIVNSDLNLGHPANVTAVRNGMLASADETISVRYFPSEDPTCSIDVPGPVENGRVVTLTCVSSEGNPDVTLKWDGITGENTRSGSTVTLKHKVGVTSEINGNSFSCLMTSPDAYPGVDRMCSVGPITVTQSTELVSVSLRSMPLSLKGNREEFQCSPEFLGSTRWFTQPELDQSRTTLMGNDVFVILDIGVGDIGTRIFCEATRPADGAVYRGYFEIQQPTTVEFIPTTRITTFVTGTVKQTIQTVPSRTNVISSLMTTSVAVATGKPDGIDIILIAVVAGAGGFVLLVAFAIIIACCCCCRKRGPKKVKQQSEYDWEGHPPSHARTASIKPPSPVPDRGPDPIVVRNPNHGAAPQNSQTEHLFTPPQTELLFTPQDQVNQTEISPSLLFAMKNLVDEDDVSDNEGSLEADRLRIPRAVAREPPNARGKKIKEQDIASGSFVSRGHPIKRTPLSSLERGHYNDPVYSSSERPNQRSSTDPTYAPLNNLPGQQRPSPPDVTVIEDPYSMFANIDRSSSGLQMPDITVGVADRSPIVNIGGSPKPSPDNTAIPKKKKLPAGARAAIGPAVSKAFSRQPNSQTTRLSAEIISSQDVVPNVSGNTAPSQPPNSGPNVAPPTYEDVSRLKAQGLINSGFQLGPTDTMVIHHTSGQTNNAPGQNYGSPADNSNNEDIKYF